MGRAPCCDKANVKRGPWSPEEDSKLKDYIHNHGTGGNWIALPQKAGLRRCGKSCRLRWLNYLRPNIKHGEFSEEEDRIICSLYANIGSRWSIIAAQLAGRTDNDIKNYWNTKLKKKLMTLLPPPPPPPPQIRKSPYHDQHHHQSSPQNHPAPFSSHDHHSLLTSSSSTSSSLYTSYYNTSTPPTTISFTALEPFSVIPSSTATSLPFYQNQEALVSSVSPPMQYNLQQYYPMVSDSTAMFMFGSEGSCSTSSDGSCSRENNNNIIIKQEQQEVAFQSYNNMFEDNSLMLREGITTNYNDAISVDNYQQCYWGEKPNGCYYQTPTTTPLDYEIEVIKQLISSSNSCNDGYLSVDENKREEKAMCKYNNNY